MLEAHVMQCATECSVPTLAVRRLQGVTRHLLYECKLQILMQVAGQLKSQV
jgi:hypothetical protein